MLVQLQLSASLHVAKVHISKSNHNIQIQSWCIVHMYVSWLPRKNALETLRILKIVGRSVCDPPDEKKEPKSDWALLHRKICRKKVMRNRALETKRETVAFWRLFKKKIRVLSLSSNLYFVHLMHFERAPQYNNGRDKFWNNARKQWTPKYFNFLAL